MRLIVAFFKLIRLPNLIFIALTQVLFQFCIFQPLYQGLMPANDLRNFTFLVLASLFIAAAGYVINDYFDIYIDEVNRPEKMVVDKYISRRWAIAWHFMLSAIGILFTALAVPVFQKWYLIVGNIICVAVLWFCSTNFKRNLLIGNIAISLLTAWTILLIFFSKVSVTNAFGFDYHGQLRLFRFAFLYAGFAFITSLIREAIKDVEDLPGDIRYGCRTMPIVWGINSTKVYVAVWMIILIATLVLIQMYVLQLQWWGVVIYSLLFILAPAIYIFSRLFKASSTEDYHRLSSWIKWVMLTGIISMVVFYFYL
jgi:4-hydroxybenzoate polyprenyltransferase